MLEEPSLFADKDFRMNLFNAASDKTQEFKELCKHNHSEKTQKVSGSINQVAHYELFINELFDPQIETNQEINVLMDNIATLLLSLFLKEVWGPKKTSMQHLSINHGELFLRNSAEGQRHNGLDVRVFNDPCDSTFSVLSTQITTYTHISITNDEYMTLCKKN